MSRLTSASSLTKRWRRFYKSLPIRQVFQLLSKSRSFCQSKIQGLVKMLDCKVIFAILLLLILIKFPLTSWSWLTSTILDVNSDSPNSEPLSESLKSLGFYLLGTGIAPLGLYLTYNRTQSLRMQTDTDTFTKSIKLLGNSSSAVRQGGIYSLGGIARDNSKLHTRIMKIMASYIREKTYENLNKLLKQEGLQGTTRKGKIRNQEEKVAIGIGE